jgi:multiple sugar transport system permease protein
MTTLAIRESATPRRRKNGRFKEANTVVAHAFMAVLGFVMAFPFLWQLIMSLSTNNEVTGVPPTLWPKVLQWQNYVNAFTVLPFAHQMWVTIQITIIVNVAHVIFATMAGYAFARMSFPFKEPLFYVVIAVLMIPGQVFILPVYQIIQSLNLLNTIAGIVLPGLISAFGVFLMRQFFETIPVELEEAARLDGANSWQVFTKVMLPLTAPGISALVVLGILDSWNDLLWPLIVATGDQNQPISVGLATLQGDTGTDYVTMMAASFMAMAPILILFIFMQRRVLEGITFVSK